jgi:Holliday junction resolvasome RuvABC endonuclease subunit
MSRQIPVVGMDPSLRHWGISIGVLDLDTNKITIQKLNTIEPTIPTGKQVRQNSKDIEAARQLTAGAVDALKQAKMAFVEVPVGSQSARAMASYAICVGILGALRAGGLQFMEVTASEVKVAATGDPTASKKQMIDWAMKTHPEANWPTYTRKGVVKVTESTAEHMADATGAIHAGIKSNQFQQLISLL